MANFRVKTLCKEKGITMAQLAEKISVTPSALSQMLNNGNPNLSTLEKIADALDVAITDLFVNDRPSGYIILGDKTYIISSRKDLEEVLSKMGNE